MTRDNVAPAGLPGKDWFSLDALAAKWSRDTGRTVTPDDLLHYGARHGLRVGLYLVETMATRGKIEIHQDAPDAAPAKGWDDTGLPAWIDGPHRIEPAVVGEIINHGGARVGVVFDNWQSADLFPEPGRSVDGYALDTPREITAGDLIVPAGECERFEEEHRIGAHAGEMPEASEELHPRAKRGMLRVIAALDAYMGAPDEAFTAADAILDKLSGCEDLPDRKTLAKYLREAREVTRYR